MEHDAWFFIGVFVFIFLIWAATGGPLHPLAFTGPTLAQPGALGGGTYLQLPRSPLTIGTSDVALPGSTGTGSRYTGSGSSGSVSPTPSLGGGVSFGEASPFRSAVSLSHYVSGAGSVDPRNEYVEISVSQDAGVPIDLTGWSLVSSATGKSVMIPKGTEMPTSGVVNAVQDIVLLPGDRAIVVSGQSPIGASFRENKCIGYFSSFQTFSPSLPLNCPTPKDEFVTKYGGEYIRDAKCMDYVDTLSRCQVVLSPPASLPGSCQAFLVKYLNYNGCVSAHQYDNDFQGRTWHVYLGRNAPLWRSTREIVKLLDIKGRTVDAFSY